MIPDEVMPATIGDNSGSAHDAARAALAEALFDRERDGGKTLANRRDEFVASANAQVVKDRRTAADAADTIKLAGEVWALIDQERRALSDPFRQTQLTLSATATDFWQRVVDAMAGLRDQIDAYTAQEDARIAEQKREQQAELKRLREAASPSAGRAAVDYSTGKAAATTAPAMRPPRRAKISGDLGSTISAQRVVTYEIEDISLIPDHIMQSPTVREAILSVVKATARHMGVPAGIRAVESTANQIR